MKTRSLPSLFRLATRVLGSLALLSQVGSPTHAADPVRLTELPIHRYVHGEGGKSWLQTGHLASSGLMSLITETLIEEPLEIPGSLVGHPLVVQATWRGFYDQDPEIVANFAADTNAGIRIRSEWYFPVAVAPVVGGPSGELINISTRAYVVPGREPVIAGFVVNDYRRRVLIRGVGPTLGAFGVTEPLADPTIALYRNDVDALIATNDNWQDNANKDAIVDARSLVGAFALGDGAADAEMLIDLEPGVYTVHLASKLPAGGTALIEVYAVP
jgi:hypothetical protein